MTFQSCYHSDRHELFHMLLKQIQKNPSGLQNCLASEEHWMHAVIWNTQCAWRSQDEYLFCGNHSSHTHRSDKQWHPWRYTSKSVQGHQTVKGCPSYVSTKVNLTWKIKCDWVVCLLFHIQEVAWLIHSPETGYPDWRFSIIFPGKCWDGTLK